MIIAKRLVLLLFTGMIIASVACGPSAQEQKEVQQEQKRTLLCEEAIDRRAAAQAQIDQIWLASAKQVSKSGLNNLSKSLKARQQDIKDADADKNKYC